MATKKKNEFDEQHRSCLFKFGRTVIEQWEKMDTAPFLNQENQWDSAFRPKKELG